MKLSIIIVSWNVRKDLVECLKSIKKNPPEHDFEIIVIDNASKDGSIQAVTKDFPEVKTILNSQNRGFAAANNQGIAASNSQYILLLNPDTILHPNALNILIRFMDENNNAGACGPKLLNKDQSTQPSARHFPTFRAALYRHTAFRLLPIFKAQYKKWLMKDFDHNHQTDVDQLMGAALMLKRSVIDNIGNLDENFFMYYEEVDLCFRIKQAGYRIAFIPKATITHTAGRSAEQIPVKKRIMMLTSLLKFFRKHRGRFATNAFNCIFKPAIILREFINIIEASAIYLFSLLSLNKNKRKKSAKKIKNSYLLITGYSYQILFKI